MIPTVINWSGLSTGAIYAIVAMGFNVVYIAWAVRRLAQPQYLVLGTFLDYAAATTWHLAPVPGLVIGLVVCALVSAIEYVVAVRPMVGTLATRRTRHAGRLVSGHGRRDFADLETHPLSVTGVVSIRLLDMFGGRLTVAQLAVIVVAVVVSVSVHVSYRSTLLGTASPQLPRTGWRRCCKE